MDLIATASDVQQQQIESSTKIRICKHICEKKKRQCKFNSIRNSDYCVEHLAFNTQNNEALGKRVICPLDPKHSVYEKNFEKHLLKCNAKIQHLGEFDVKDINVKDINNDLNNNNNNEISTLKFSDSITTYEELNETNLKLLVDFLLELNDKYTLYDLEFNKLEDEFISNLVRNKNDSLEGNKQKKHLSQISSIVTHIDKLLTDGTCLIELGAGRGKLSYWFEQSRNDKKFKNNDYIKQNVNILLIERGSQRYKFDTILKKEMQESNAEFERIRIDLKDLYLNEVPMIKKWKNYLLYGKHLCGIATDFSIRCLKRSLEDKLYQDVECFKGLCLAVCCHHKCEWESLCGKEFFESLGVDSKLFYIIRSISSWATHGERENVPQNESVFGIKKHKIGRICKNLIDYARLRYLQSIKLPVNYKLVTKLFYYIETDVTLENSMIYAYLEKIK